MSPLTQISAIASESLVAAVWEGLILAACVALCLRLLPAITAAARSIIWLAVMLAVVLLPFLHLGGSATVTAPTSRFHVDERVSLVLIAAWTLISIVRGTQLIRSALYLRRIARNATPLQVETAGIHDERAVALCVSDEVDRPSVVGFFSPRILIPATLLDKLTQPELQQIVLHEMEHLRRRDDWTNLFQKLSLVLFPLNPVLIWIERRLCLERELACDDQVLRTTNARKAYAACLANLAEHSLVRRGVSLALGAWERQPELVRRVHRILASPAREMSRRQTSLVAATIILALFAGADGLAHTPRLISFGPATSPESVASAAPATGSIGRAVQAKTIISTHPSGYTLTSFEVPKTPARPKLVKHPIHRLVVNRLKPELRASAFTAEEVRQTLDPQRQSDDGVVVLVTFRTAPSTSGNPSSQFAYAAVPTRNGWLFVKL